MDNWELYNFTHRGKGGNSEDGATLDALIDRSITKISNDRVMTIGNSIFAYCEKLTEADFHSAVSIKSSAFLRCYGLSKANFPIAASIDGNAFSYCSNLKTINLPNAISVGNQAFQGCSNLKTVKLLNNDVATLTNSNAFNNTPIANGSGYIYVPDDLVEDYRTATNWVIYADQIKPISELEATE